MKYFELKADITVQDCPFASVVTKTKLELLTLVSLTIEVKESLSCDSLIR